MRKMIVIAAIYGALYLVALPVASVSAQQYQLQQVITCEEEWCQPEEPTPEQPNNPPNTGQTETGNSGVIGFLADTGNSLMSAVGAAGLSIIIGVIIIRKRKRRETPG